MNGYPLRTQAGMVLLFCLIFLTALTLLGLSASSDSIIQYQMVANLQQTERAKQAAQATLRWAEQWLTDLPGPAPESCQTSNQTGNQTACTGFSVQASGSLIEHPEFESLAWWQTHGFVAGTDPHTGEQLETIATTGVDPPLWIIESIHEIPATENASNRLQVWYRLLARGSGHTGTTVSVIESIVRKDWPGIADTIPQTTERVAWQELR
jgi:Tfp pilus assembly protein PilX